MPRFTQEEINAALNATYFDEEGTRYGVVRKGKMCLCPAAEIARVRGAKFITRKIENDKGVLTAEEEVFGEDLFSANLLRHSWLDLIQELSLDRRVSSLLREEGSKFLERIKTLEPKNTK